MSEAARGPQRTCLGCRQALERSRLVRYVRAPEGTLLVDYRERLPGRGAYTCATRECITAALKRRQFDRAFKSPCTVPSAEELCAALSRELYERLLSLLGMARKSGQLLAGSNLVLDALERPERLQVILVARDVAPGIGEKVFRKAAGKAVACLHFADKALLGQLLGRDEYSVAALNRGRLAAAFLDEWEKFTELSGEN